MTSIQRSLPLEHDAAGLALGTEDLREKRLKRVDVAPDIRVVKAEEES